ncbi:Sodium-dependent transporter family protein [Thioalkalivibrio nitratireducens DSM 14787]|uniref:Transporter n=1 Tax=Thioalkalivibrio nitratireducens (strain DSM 14787 / UNIQEM 213 / ALEN2) TaxID=1255043 RepID=L0E0M3_THIND|nr:sodium-dependent transporter [Thioalkalivibrio nitratireducens]AGA34797.1 Sodium-dependent transporter family protein [Thioalkalivibrio nitratireducens DSM 14787]
MPATVSIHGQWSTRLAFILAATGSAVGLGNIWRFPYIAGENGGGAFVLVYLACILLIGLPIMMAEILLGRRGRQSPINTMLTVAREEGLSRGWGLMGWIGVLAGFLILSFYSVIAGWALAYVFKAGSGGFTGLDADGSSELFGAMLADPEALLAWHTIFMVMTAMVVARGVQSGLERAVTILVPALVVLLIILVGYSMAQGAFADGLRFLFRPDFSALSANAVLLAMGQAFFTLSLGMGAIMVYGSYLSSDAAIAKTSGTVVAADTLVALLAGLAIFPILLAAGLSPAQGPGLIFVTLPLAFAEMPLGLYFGTLFFILLVFAAWTSAISLIEPAVAFLVENLGATRVFATTTVAMLAWLLGIGALLSLNVWAEYTLFDRGILDLLDYLTANILLPLGGFLIALFVGWRMTERSVQSELRLKLGWLFTLWYFLVRYVAPIAILVVFLRAVGLV